MLQQCAQEVFSSTRLGVRQSTKADKLCSPSLASVLLMEGQIYRQGWEELLALIRSSSEPRRPAQHICGPLHHHEAPFLSRACKSLISLVLITQVLSWLQLGGQRPSERQSRCTAQDIHPLHS